MYPEHKLFRSTCCIVILPKIFHSVPENLCAIRVKQGNTPPEKMSLSTRQSECQWGKYHLISNVEGFVPLSLLSEISVLCSSLRAVMRSLLAQRQLFRALLYQLRWKWPSGTIPGILQHDRYGNKHF